MALSADEDFRRPVTLALTGVALIGWILAAYLWSQASRTQEEMTVSLHAAEKAREALAADLQNLQKAAGTAADLKVQATEAEKALSEASAARASAQNELADLTKQINDAKLAISGAQEEASAKSRDLQSVDARLKEETDRLAGLQSQDQELATEQTRRAVELLVELARSAPDELTSWHYDQVDAALGSGKLALAAAWPGATGALRASPAGHELEPHPYLSGPAGLRSYAGCHGWAIPRTSGDLDGARALIARLCSAEAHALEAESGAVCARVDVFAALRGADELDARRLAITRRTIADGMITYPPLARFPEIEDAGWGALQRALRGELDVDGALCEMQAKAVAVLEAKE